MRRAATWLVVGGVLIVGGVAAVAAFLGDGDATVERPETDASARSATTELRDRLEESGAHGLLYVGSPDGERCDLQAIRLPDLEVEFGFSISDCRFAVSPEGLIATGFDCRQSGAIWDTSGVVLEQFSGCAPAWKPDGTLTFLRRGDLMEVPESCTASIDECARVALSRKDLTGELPRVGGRTLVLREIAWLDDARLGAIVRGRRADFIAVFVGREPVARPSFGVGELTGLAVDRRRRRLLVIGDEIQGMVELDDLGRFRDPFSGPPVLDVASIAVAPDGAWAAVSGRSGVVVYQTGEEEGRIFPLPFAARPVAWLQP